MLLENQELRNELGRRGREIVMDEFSSTLVIQQTLALYYELLNGGAPDFSGDGPSLQMPDSDRLH